MLIKTELIGLVEALGLHQERTALQEADQHITMQAPEVARIDQEHLPELLHQEHLPIATLEVAQKVEEVITLGVIPVVLKAAEVIAPDVVPVALEAVEV